MTPAGKGRRTLVFTLAGAALLACAIGGPPAYRWAKRGAPGPTCGEGRFVVHPGDVRDTREGLTWGPIAPSGMMTWRAAGEYCHALGMRLPEMDEINVLSTRPPYLDSTDKLDGCVFTRTQLGSYWSASQPPTTNLPLLGRDVSGLRETLWIASDLVSFLEQEETKQNLVRCVRSFPP